MTDTCPDCGSETCDDYEHGSARCVRRQLAAKDQRIAELARESEEARRLHSVLHDAASGGCLHTLLRHEHACAVDSIDALREKSARLADLATERDALAAERDEALSRCQIAEEDTSWLLDRIADQEVYTGDTEKWQARRAEMEGLLQSEHASHRAEQMERDARIAELETAPLIVAEARLDAIREELGRELLDSVEGDEPSAVAALQLRITELERLLKAANEILGGVY